MKLEIEKVLVLSTAHITAETAAALPNGIPSLIVHEKGEYGWLIYTNLGITLNMKHLPNDLPEELATLIHLAQQNNCVWLMLDRDGQTQDFLPIYEW